MLQKQFSCKNNVYLCKLIFKTKQNYILEYAIQNRKYKGNF